MPAPNTADRVVVSVMATESGDWQVVSTPTGFQGITTAAGFADNDYLHGFVRFENGEDWEVYDTDDDSASGLLQISNITGTVTISRPATPYASSNSGDRVNAGSGTHTLTISLGSGTMKRIIREINGEWKTLTSGDATPDVSGFRLFKTAGTTTITAFDNMEAGKLFIVRRGASDISIADGAGISLPSDATITLTAANPSAIFVEDNGVAYLIGTVGTEVLDEDDFSSNSAIKPPSQQSVAAYFARVPNRIAATELTIATGVIAPTLASHTVDTESDAASDDLDTITAGSFVAGGELTLAAAHTDRTVVLKHGTGNIVHPEGLDVSLDATTKTAKLRYDGTSWNVIATGAAVLDEDDFASDSATRPPSQQSVKAFYLSTASGRGASAIGSEDAGDYWDGEDAEAIFQEIGARLARVVYIDDPAYGAAGNAVHFNDGIAVNTDATFTSASADFTGRAGQKIAILGAAAAGADSSPKIHITTIANVTDANTVELTSAPTASTPLGARFYMGTDDTSAYQAAVAAVNALGDGAALAWTPGKGYWIEGEGVFTVPYTWYADGARIYLPALGFSTSATVASDIVETLATTPGYTDYNDAVDPANHVADTTLSADMEKGHVRITVASTSGLRRGMGLYFVSDEGEYATTLPTISYYKRGEYNEISEIISSTVIQMRWPATRTYSRNGGTNTVTVKAFENIKGIKIFGGEYYGHGYGGDLVNGAGQHIFVLKHADTFIKDAYFEHVSGYPVYTMYGYTRASNVVIDGRPPYVAWSEGATSMWGGFMVHAGRYELDRCIGYRLRHLTDGGAACSIRTFDCEAYDCHGSPYRTHIQVAEEIHVNAVADGCGSWGTSDAIEFQAINPVLRRGESWGFQTADDRELSPARRAVFVNPQFELTGGNGYSADAIASTISVEGNYETFQVHGGELIIRGGGATSHGIRVTTDGGIDACDYLQIKGTTIRMVGGNAAARAIIIGASTNNNVIEGIVEDCTLYCPDQSVLIELFDGDGSPDADNIIIRNNQEMSASPTASAVVTQNGSNYGSNVHIYQNYLLSEASSGGGGGSSFPAYTNETPTVEFATNGDANFTVTQYTLRRSINGKRCAIQFRIAGSVTHSTASGELRMVTSNFEPELTVIGLPVVQIDGAGISCADLNAAATQWYGHAASNGTGSTRFTFYALGPGIEEVQLTASNMPSGESFDFRGTFEINIM